MTAKDIAIIVEEFAPLRFQESYDNAGFTVGNPNREVRSVLLTVDVTMEVIDEAIECGADMIISHHPIIFTALKHLTSSSYVERCVERAIKGDIILYAAHTNLDSAPGGMSWRLAEMLGVENLRALCSSSVVGSAGFGVVGELPESADALEYINYVGRKVGCGAVRHSDITPKRCSRVAICTGSGGSLMEDVRRSGADLYITADLRYNDFMTPNGEFTVADIGHFESEYCAIEILFDILSKKMINFALHKSKKSRNPIGYISVSKI